MALFHCALDIRKTSTRMVLFGFWPGEPPTLLETSLLRPGQSILKRLEQWLAELHLHPREGVVMGCCTDPWPPRLAQRLRQAGFVVHWLDPDAPLHEGVVRLRTLQPAPLYTRATLMAHWPSARAPGELAATVLEIQYRILRARLADLELELWTQGRLRCPDHPIHYCSQCVNWVLEEEVTRPEPAPEETPPECGA